jgi:hypothetical protein
MKATRQEVRTFIVRLYCDCGKEMTTYKVLMCDPPKFHYSCKCGKEYTSTTRFPTQELAPIGKEDVLDDKLV